MAGPQQKQNTLLRKARLAKGWSQFQLAEEIGVDEKSVQRWETGKSTPRPSLLRVLCDTLAKTPEELGFGDPEEGQPGEDQPAPQQREPCQEQQRWRLFPLQVSFWKRTSSLPHRRNLHLMIAIISTLVVALLVRGVVMTAFFHLPILRQSTTNASENNCDQPFSGTPHGRLDARWHWDNPGESATLCVDPHGFLSITAPASSDLYPGHNFNAPRLLQSITGDFTIQTHLQFHFTKNFQSAGLLLWQDQTTFLRFERDYGQQIGLLFQKNNKGSYSSVSQKNSLTSAESLDLKIQKHGDHFTVSWREPGYDWQTDGETTLHFDHLMVGLDVIAYYKASQATATFTSFTVSYL